jgi:hypothetical protein
MMRYELADYVWAAFKPILPNKPRGFPRVNDRRVLSSFSLVLRPGVVPPVFRWRRFLAANTVGFALAKEAPERNRQLGWLPTGLASSPFLSYVNRSRWAVGDWSGAGERLQEIMRLAPGRTETLEIASLTEQVIVRPRVVKERPTRKVNLQWPKLSKYPPL